MIKVPIHQEREDSKFSMNRIFILLLIIIPLSGCSTLRSIDGSTQETIEKKDNPVLWRKVNILENHAINSQVNTGTLQKEVKKLNQELDTAKKKIETLQGQVQQLILDIENEKIPVATKESRAIPQPAAEPEHQSLTEKSTTGRFVDERTRDHQVIKDKKSDGEDLHNLQIKVLSGDGHQDSAERMKNKLTGMGYPVRMIDLAPRKNFASNAIFFASGYRDQAEQLAKKIGGDIPIKPISWHSVYNIIVVSAQ